MRNNNLLPFEQFPEKCLRGIYFTSVVQFCVIEAIISKNFDLNFIVRIFNCIFISLLANVVVCKFYFQEITLFSKVLRTPKLTLHCKLVKILSKVLQLICLKIIG